MRQTRPEIVITGLGVVTPIGIGHEAYWRSLLTGESGVRPIRSFDAARLPVTIAAEIQGFEPQKYVRPRKGLKVMSRETQLGMAAADLAWSDAGLAAGSVEPDRLGVVFGAGKMANTIEEIVDGYKPCFVDGAFHFSRWFIGMEKSYPLGMLKTLPNMLAAHISIAIDARGPNNTLHHGDLSSLAAIGEAAATIERGAADVMLAGGVDSRMQPIDWARSMVLDGLSRRASDQLAVPRPFDADRDGQVRGEGGAAFILERREHAEARRAKIWGRLASWVTSGPAAAELGSGSAGPLRRAIRSALSAARIDRGDLGHVNAHGLGTPCDDRVEAQAIAAELATIPVLALKGSFGNLGAGGGAAELAASLLALDRSTIPPSANFERPDPECPIPVVHGGAHPLQVPAFLKLSQTRSGQAAAVVVIRD